MEIKNETKLESKSLAITPSDTIPLDKPGRIVVTKKGDLCVVAATDLSGGTLTYHNVDVGFSLPYDVGFVKATGTTAAVVHA